MCSSTAPDTHPVWTWRGREGGREREGEGGGGREGEGGGGREREEEQGGQGKGEGGREREEEGGGNEVGEEGDGERGVREWRQMCKRQLGECKGV